jgi:mannosyltransferase OCH1-like enzyme
VEPPPVRWPEPIIPKLIHQTWKGRDKSKPLPGWVQSSVNSWKSTNPGYVHKMHDDDDIEKRVKTLHPELLPAYEQMKPIQRADLFRYMVLYDEGGYYADCDVDCSQPIDSWVGQYEPRAFYDVHFIAGLEIVTNGKAVREHWFAREFQFVQWTMGAAPGHPILAGVLRNIQE